MASTELKFKIGTLLKIKFFCMEKLYWKNALIDKQLPSLLSVSICCILLSEVVYCTGTCLHIEKLLIEENSSSLPYNSNKHFNNRLQVKTPGKKCKRRDSIKVLL